jgi:hypothetical protein
VRSAAAVLTEVAEGDEPGPTLPGMIINSGSGGVSQI